MSYEKYFSNKKITLMGLGLLGRGLGVAKFLAECDAKLLITDLKSEKELRPSLKKLEKFCNIKYVLARHRLSDFRRCHMVIKAAGVPLDSPFIKEAKKNNIPVEMDASLFAKLSPATIIGITGTRGKSTTTQMIYKTAKQYYQKGRLFLGGNIKGLATLPLLKKVKRNDLVVLELDSWQLQGFGEAKISPHIAVFTTFFQDHLNYYQGKMGLYFNDKANIFRHQKDNDYLIVSSQAYQEIKKRYKRKIKSKVIVAKVWPKNWTLKIKGEHNLLNAGLAFEALNLLGLRESDIKRAFKNYEGEPGRLEFIAKKDGISYYNDTNSTVPEATMAGLSTLANNKKNIVLIAGGSDKGLDYSKMVKLVCQKAKALVLIKGTATDKILNLLPTTRVLVVKVVEDMKEAVKKARSFSQKGDVILLSPGAASFGLFKNEYDRGAQFVRQVRRL